LGEEEVADFGTQGAEGMKDGGVHNRLGEEELASRLEDAVALLEHLVGGLGRFTLQGTVKHNVVNSRLRDRRQESDCICVVYGIIW
jgi:hypothetical protein